MRKFCNGSGKCGRVDTNCGCAEINYWHFSSKGQSNRASGLISIQTENFETLALTCLHESTQSTSQDDKNATLDHVKSNVTILQWWQLEIPRLNIYLSSIENLLMKTQPPFFFFYCANIICNWILNINNQFHIQSARKSSQILNCIGLGIKWLYLYHHYSALVKNWGTQVLLLNAWTKT